MKYEVRTIINGRRLFVKVDYKRYVKKTIEAWEKLGATYVDIRPITDEIPEEKVKVLTPPETVGAKVVNWPKVKTWLEKYGT